MTTDLQGSIVSTLNTDYEMHEHRSMLTYALMIDKLINPSEKAIETMTHSIKEYNISTVSGENVALVVCCFNHAYKRLEHNRTLTFELKNCLFKVCQTTSVDNFNSIIFAWHHNVLLGTQPCPVYKSFLTKVEDHYKDIIVGSKWHVTANQGAVFTAKPSLHPQTPAPTLTPAALPHTSQKVKCHFCGGGHLWPDCAKWAWYKKQICIAPTSNDKKVQADPPCFEMIINGKTHEYCKKCCHGSQLGCWTPSHYTNEHSGKQPRTDQPQANVATSDSVETVTTDGTCSISFNDALMMTQAGG
eukprot:1957045-Ditylum_brightwellii.AAC.1